MSQDNQQDEGFESKEDQASGGQDDQEETIEGLDEDDDEEDDVDEDEDEDSDKPSGAPTEGE